MNQPPLTTSGSSTTSYEPPQQPKRLSTSALVLIIIGAVVVATVMALALFAGIVSWSTKGVVKNGDSAACRTDEKTLETAQEAYRAQRGSYAASQAELVSAGLILSPSDGFDTDRTGSVTPKPNGRCATRDLTRR